MMFVMRGTVRPTGGFSISSFVGFSVARARAPSVSMIKFTHNHRTAIDGTQLAETVATKLIITKTCKVDGEMELDELLDIIVHTSPPHQNCSH